MPTEPHLLAVRLRQHPCRALAGHSHAPPVEARNVEPVLAATRDHGLAVHLEPAGGRELPRQQLGLDAHLHGDARSCCPRCRPLLDLGSLAPCCIMS